MLRVVVSFVKGNVFNIFKILLIFFFLLSSHSVSANDVSYVSCDRRCATVVSSLSPLLGIVSIIIIIIISVVIIIISVVIIIIIHVRVCTCTRECVSPRPDNDLVSVRKAPFSTPITGKRARRYA